jgi:hypothetical protein
VVSAVRPRHQQPVRPEHQRVVLRDVCHHTVIY